MTSKRGSRPDDRYISNNLRQSTWDALRELQADTRREGVNPSQSTLVHAVITVARHNMPDLIAELRDAE